MPRITIELSDEDVASIEAEVDAGRAANRATAVAALIDDARRYRVLEEIGRLAQEGIESGEPIPVTPEYWQKKRAAFRARRKLRSSK
jgi:Arc/MetJ-type ribon-helix-helix transcriptional regulator